MSHTTATLPAVGDVDIYPVGVLADLRRLRVRLVHGHDRTSRRAFVRSFVRQAARSWRRRSYWNGYLAEPRDGAWMWTRCGRGWTRRAALRRLERHVADVAAQRVGELVRLEVERHPR